MEFFLRVFKITDGYSWCLRAFSVLTEAEHFDCDHCDDDLFVAIFKSNYPRLTAFGEWTPCRVCPRFQIPFDNLSCILKDSLGWQFLCKTILSFLRVKIACLFATKLSVDPCDYWVLHPRPKCVSLLIGKVLVPNGDLY